ncbi:MAG: 30S ribosomal protein S7 [Deltaproteobacteria bacterium CG_4_8_14_3_um_filter_45_9]|jgi:small subunit ribosomal protein S7|nr:MAG: 30S ribosomal protein S7 [Deltaproteobacteria bacterium CG03_land_8_20_14_0_80_45_14]PIX21344.1 MAG: 30S ribosomal protein S7 [Deltaproteobacteria bacterium CG_4_8_14_3_um_filter_45_9]
MPRKREVKKREILPDPKYHDTMTAKFINGVMRRGKKSSAEGTFYRALDIIKDRTHSDPIKIFSQAMNNVKPLIEVRPRRVGGATYQVPVEVRPERKVALAIRWIIGFAKQRSEKTMEEKLSAELMDAANNRGAAIKKKEDTHKMAEANKAFAHYRW